jgi:hypothetical protein
MQEAQNEEMSMDLDLIEEFVARYRPREARRGQADQLPGVEELREMKEALSDVLATLPLSALTDAQREALAGKRSPQLQELLVQCARGLRMRPDVARAVGVDPKVVEQVGEQDMVIVRLVKAAQDVHQGAQRGAQQVAALAEEEGERVMQEVRGRLRSEETPAAERSSLKVAFTEGFRLHAGRNRREERAAYQAERRQRPLLEELAVKREELDKVRMVREIKEGK